MTAQRMVQLACDWPTCYARHETRILKPTTAREDAQTRGWTYVDGLDLCGPPKESDNYLAAGGFNLWFPADHAQLYTAGEHRPDLERYDKGPYFRPGCTCGWRWDPLRTIWQSRFKTVRVWLSRHLYDVVEQQQAAERAATGAVGKAEA